MSVRLAVIGCGAVARRFHLPALKGTDAQVVAFASRTLDSAQAARDEWGSGDVTDDWREIVRRDDVDAVDVCTPNHLHAEIAQAAARAGKHVLVEKPMARTAAECDAMIAAAREADVVLRLAHNVRYAPPFAAARQQVAAGAVGDVTGVRAAFGHSGPGDWAPGVDWFFDPERSGGGVLIDLGVHIIDTLRAILDDDVTEVAAMLYGAGPVEDAAHLLLRLSSGVVASIQTQWIARPPPDHQLTIFGTQGTLHLDSRTPLRLRRADGTDEAVELPQRGPNPYADFVAAVGGGDAGVSPEDGRAAVAVVRAAYEAAARGAAVRLDGAELP